MGILCQMNEIGLGSRLKHYRKYLSSGKAFFSESYLLFADEPTGIFDAANGESVIRRLS